MGEVPSLSLRLTPKIRCNLQEVVADPTNNKPETRGRIMVANDATTPVRRINSGHARTVDLVRIYYVLGCLCCVVLLYCGTTKRYEYLTHFCIVVYFTYYVK